MSNKIALVTGSSRGIGAAIALQLAKDGYDVFIHYRNHKEEAENVLSKIKEIGGKAFILNGDLTKEDDLKHISAEIAKVSDKIDLLVNNAGMDHAKLFFEYSINDMREILDSVLWATILTTKIMLPFILKSDKGQIINISSRLGREKTIKTASVYGAAKAGVNKFTQALALELSEYKIRVNCVAPGLTKTDLTNDIFIQEKGSQEEAEKMWKLRASENPSGRVGEPEDIANAVSFLASERASYINGEIIGVNGGSILV